MIQIERMLVALLLAAGLASCATQAGMLVNSGAVVTQRLPKYNAAIAVRSVTGGKLMNVVTMPGVMDEPFKAALESSLAGMGYLASTHAARYTIDVEIHDLQQPFIALDVDVTASVTYKMTYAGGGAAVNYPVTAKGSATLSDSVLGTDRLRIATERAMRENIKAFLTQLR